MKGKIKYLVITILIFIVAILLFSTKSYAGSQRLKMLKYDVNLNADGTVDVEEEWNIQVSETNTLFKTFDLDSTKYGKIENVRVRDMTDGTEKEFRNTGEYAYHVEEGGFYALNRSTDEFEIAWGVSIDNTENKIYKINYTITDAIKNYNDCSEFYWQFIGKTNEIPADKVTGIIKLPYEVSDRENLKVWAHGPLDGNIRIVDNKTVEFEVEDLSTETMVEVRIVTTENIFAGNLNTKNQNKLQSILDEEMEWADRANRQRKTIQAIIIGLLVISAIIAIFFIYKIIKYIKMLSQIEKTKPEVEYDYFRDFPDENATPAEAAFLYYFDKKSQFTNNISKIVSGIILNLALKKAISFEKTAKDEVLILINDEVGKNLKKDEINIYEMLKKTYDYTKKKTKNQEIEGITVKDIEKYAMRNDTAFLRKIEGLEKIVAKSEEEKGNYDQKLVEEAEKRGYITILYVIFGFMGIIAFMLIVPLIIGILSIICAILNSKIANKMRMLTQKGANEQEKWKALKRYMEEYSLLKEREVPELVLWEKYLVYATAFGIADKVLKQLKVTYPQIADENYMMNNGYTYMYMMNRINFNTAITGGIQRAYTAGINQRAARNYSSGSGRWRRFLNWRRWPEVGGRSEWAEDRPNTLTKCKKYDTI